MEHYDFPRKFRAIYKRALAAYRRGAGNANELLSAGDVVFLEGMGVSSQALFDYAEDVARHGEPDFETALLIESVRRDYFLTVQRGKPSPTVLDEATLPPKNASVKGVKWLPRLIPKARAKLRGELPGNLMYCCGGDRDFFKVHDIHPAEFLRAVWAWEKNEAKLMAWFRRRSRAGAAA